MTRGGKLGWRIPRAWPSILFPGLPIRGGVPFEFEGELVETCSADVRGLSPGALPSLLEETSILLNEFTMESTDGLLDSAKGEGSELVEDALLDGERVASPVFRLSL